MSNAERFLNAYAVIEHEMNEIAGETKYIPFSQLLYKCAKSSWVVSRYQQSLREYNELRNAIVHLRDGKREIIAEPSDEVTADIEKIASLMETTENLWDYVSKPVKTLSPYDTVESAYHKMEALDSTKMPVYEGSQFVGMLAVEHICRWAMTDRDENKLVKDILTSSKKDRVVFLKKSAKATDAVQAFENALNHGAQLLAVIVTEHGSQKEKPLGIITAKDFAVMINDIL